MQRSMRFSRCNACGHQAIIRRAACALCGGDAREAPPPVDLLDGWRCDCYHCVSTPC